MLVTESAAESLRGLPRGQLSALSNFLSNRFPQHAATHRPVSLTGLPGDFWVVRPRELAGALLVVGQHGKGVPGDEFVLLAVMSDLGVDLVGDADLPPEWLRWDREARRGQEIIRAAELV